jgi:hypothetical protein
VNAERRVRLIFDFWLWFSKHIWQVSEEEGKRERRWRLNIDFLKCFQDTRGKEEREREGERRKEGLTGGEVGKARRQAYCLSQGRTFDFHPFKYWNNLF